jgi:transcriptional regulator with XRE-family HTH domain
VDARRSDPAADRSGFDPWSAQLDALGEFIRTQRQLAKLSLREMAELTSVSNAYLSQIERGLHQPSLKVLRAIAEALHLSTEQLLAQGGWMREGEDASDSISAERRPPAGGSAPGGEGGEVEEAIRRDQKLSPAQREALLGVYRSFIEGARG